jgi:hypothetical protein
MDVSEEYGISILRVEDKTWYQNEASKQLQGPQIILRLQLIIHTRTIK